MLLGLVAATLALIYFATMIWGPENAPVAPNQNYLRELGDEPGAETAPAGETDDDGSEEVSLLGGPTPDTPVTLASGSRLDFATRGLRPDEMHSLDVRLRDAAGQPVADAEVRVFKAAGPADRPPLAALRPDDGGRVTVRGLPHAQYRIEVDAPGYHPVRPKPVELPMDGTRFDFVLATAAELVAWCEDRAGRSLRAGCLRLNHEDGSAPHYVEASVNGRFVSGPLRAGDWTVTWLPHRHASEARGLQADFELHGGESTRVRIVLPQGAADPRHPVEAGLQRVGVTAH